MTGKNERFEAQEGFNLPLQALKIVEVDHELRNVKWASETGNGLWLIGQQEIEGLSLKTTGTKFYHQLK